MKVNIYITQENRKQLENIKNKYQVSLSTIAEKTAYWLTYTLYRHDEKLANKTIQEYINKTQQKTSIKPKTNQFLQAQIEKLKASPNILYTNAIILYLDKTKLKNLVNDKNLLQEYYKQIDKDLQKTIEPNWNYNNFKRNFYRYNKENEKNN